MGIHITLSSDDNRADVVRKRYIILYKWVWLPLDKRLLVSIIYISSIDDIYTFTKTCSETISNDWYICCLPLYDVMIWKLAPKKLNWVVQIYTVSLFRISTVRQLKTIFEGLKNTEHYCPKGSYAGQGICERILFA